MSRVTHLHSVSSNKSYVKLPRQLESVRDRHIALCVAYLDDMLDGADDALYALLEKAGAEDQLCYFDAMRELRVQRSRLVTGFRQSLDNLFRSPGHQGDQAELPREPVDLDSLGLVNEDELETAVALDNMARRARNGCDEQLRAVNHRMEYLLEGKVELGERYNPLEPRQLLAAFSEGLDKLTLDIKARLIILKLFEREVMAETGYLVSEANSALIAAGVLPDMKTAPIPAARKPGHRTISPPSDSPAVSPVPPTESGNDQMFGLLQELLVTMRSLQGHTGVQSSGPADVPMAVMHNGVPFLGGAPVANAAQVRPVSSDDLLAMLDRLQRVERTLSESESERVTLKGELSDLLDSEHGKALHALDQADDDVINLVSLLFDFILDDDGLPSEIKALIGRLQIPLLKVAITDKTFFSNEAHEARVLLNVLARAGCQWDPQQGIQDDLYQRIHQAVHRIIDDYDDDATLFQSLLDEFDHYLATLNSRSDRVEQRVREAEEGKVLAEQARKAVAAALDKRLAGRKLQDVVVRLLRDGWQQVLLLTWLKDGEESPSWQKQLKVVDAVVWSALEHRDQAALEKLKRLSPKLLKTLQSELVAIHYDEAESQHLLAGLEAVHQQLLEGLQTERVEVAPEQPEAEDEPEQGDLPEDHFLIRKMASLPPGQWVELLDADEPRRAKLAANIRSGVKLVFTNRRGIKVAEHSAYSLAVALNKGAVKLIEEGALFDRALEAVIGDLRRMQSSHR